MLLLQAAGELIAVSETLDCTFVADDESDNNVWVQKRRTFLFGSEVF